MTDLRCPYCKDDMGPFVTFHEYHKHFIGCSKNYIERITLDSLSYMRAYTGLPHYTPDRRFGPRERRKQDIDRRCHHSLLFFKGGQSSGMYMKDGAAKLGRRRVNERRLGPKKRRQK